MGYHLISDLALHALPETAPASPWVCIRQREEPFPPPGDLLREIAGGDDTPGMRLYESAAGLHYLVGRLARFFIETTGGHIWYDCDRGMKTNEFEGFLLGPVLALALQQRGQLQVHAGAIAAGDHAIAFAAPGGTGKSTLTASFAGAGYPVLSDDTLAVDLSGRVPLALPGVPRMKLWSDSLENLGLEARRFRLALSWLDKRQIILGQDWGTQAQRPLPLKALYFLMPHQDPRRHVAFGGLAPAAAAILLLANLYQAEGLCGERARRALAGATALVSGLHVRSVSYYRSYERLPELRAALLADASSPEADQWTTL